MDIHLQRFAYTPMGTFGRLYLPEFECFTVELPWMFNRSRESCIPEGRYHLKLGMFNRGGYEAYEILEVPGRSLIKIHVGNNVNDIVGCIAPGRSLGFVEGLWSVTSSRDAYGEFMASMKTLGDGDYNILIRQYHPAPTAGAVTATASSDG